MTESWDYRQLSRELVRALRGKRSQPALSRRLGYRTNVVYLWEAGRAAPTAQGFLKLCAKVGVQPRSIIATFYRQEPAWLTRHCPDTRDGVAALLEDLKGSRTLVETAASLRCSRFAFARWLSGEAEPRLPDFLQAIEVTSLRLLDFVAAVVDPLALPCVSHRWQQMQRARRAAYEMPWSHAVLRCLELEQYKALPEHPVGWVARAIGISEETEVRALELLESTGQIQRVDQKWQITSSQTIDTRKDPQAAKQLKAWWSQVGKERLEAGVDGAFSYNLFGVSNKDLARIEVLHRAYFRELRKIVSESEQVENVAVVNLQLFSLMASTEDS